MRGRRTRGVSDYEGKVLVAKATVYVYSRPSHG